MLVLFPLPPWKWWGINFREPLRWKGHERSWSMKFSLQVISTPFYDIVFIFCIILLRELMPAKYRKCINIFVSFKKSEVQPQLTKKLYYNEYMLIMIKWKLNVILFILLKGNSHIVCIRIFLLWTYRYRGFKIFCKL